MGGFGFGRYPGGGAPAGYPGQGGINVSIGGFPGGGGGGNPPLGDWGEWDPNQKGGFWETINNAFKTYGPYAFSLIGAILRTIGGGQREGERQELAQQLTQYLGSLISDSTFRAQTMESPLFDQGLQDRSAWLRETAPQYLLDAYSGFGGPVAEAQQRFFDTSLPPEVESNLNQMLGALGPMYGPVQDRALDVLSRGGRTQETQGLWDRIEGVTTGREGELQSLPEYARLLAEGARNNPLTAALEGLGIKSAGTEGETEYSAGLKNWIGQFLEQGGATDLSTALGQRGYELFGREALPDLDAYVSLSRDMAAQAARAGAESAYGRALSRGGGPGAIVGTGSQNAAASEFEQEVAQAETKASLDAINNYIRAALQEQSTGGQAMANAGELEVRRLASALGIAPGVMSAETQRMGTGGQLGLQGRELGSEDLTRAGNLINAYNQLRLGGIGAGTGLFGQEMSALGNIGIGGQMASSNAMLDAINQVVGKQQAGQGLNIQSARDYMSSIYPFIAGQAGAAQGLWNMGWQPLEAGLGQAGRWLGFGAAPAQAITTAWAQQFPQFNALYDVWGQAPAFPAPWTGFGGATPGTTAPPLRGGSQGGNPSVGFDNQGNPIYRMP